MIPVKATAISVFNRYIERYDFLLIKSGWVCNERGKLTTTLNSPIIVSDGNCLEPTLILIMDHINFQHKLCFHRPHVSATLIVFMKISVDDYFILCCFFRIFNIKCVGWNIRLKFKHSGILLSILEKFQGIHLILTMNNGKITTCDRFDLEIPGFWQIVP